MALSPASANRDRPKDNLLDVLRLARTPRVGPVTYRQLISRFGSAAAALGHLPELAARGGGKLEAMPKALVEKEIEATAKFGARLVTLFDDDYPALLAPLPDAPPVLAVHGNAALWQRPCLGMVGARNSSAHGCNLAKKIATDVGAHGVTIVSGLARGVDAYAHSGALETGTVGVIAGGIDTMYPPENRKLYEQMRERGAIISEQAFATVPYAAAFPGRNRIIAGMSKATLVVEASLKSGSLITARLAAEYGREVGAVPGFPMDPRAAGCNKLLKEGASLIENTADALTLLEARSISVQEEAEQFGSQAVTIDDGMLEEARTRILEKLGAMPIAHETLMAECQLTPQLLFAALVELELAGRITRGLEGLALRYE